MRSYDSFYADGAFVRSGGGAAMPVADPSTGRVIGEVVPCSPEDVDQAVRSASAGFQLWSRSSQEERSEALTRLHAELHKRVDQAVSALALEMGCPVWLGQLMQLPMALKGLEFARDGIEQIIWTEQIGNGKVERVPAGVVAAITPWNFPLHQIVAKVAPAIAAGCSVVLKPSEVSPGAAQVFMEAVHSAGIPPGVVNLVWGGPDVGERLVRHADVHHISFTGSTAVGRRIMIAAAEDLKPVTLELGGKSAAVLLDDADLDAALAAVVRLSMANSGQACVSQSRLIAPRGLLGQIEERLEAALTQWPMGNPLDMRTRLGPVASRGQQERVLSMIAHAREQGARLVLGGDKMPEHLAQGCYVLPTVFSDVRSDMEIAQEEVFGPVLSVISYDSEEEAVALANSTRYGLSGAVWSADPLRALAVARDMKTGQVVINGAAQNLATPFGGWGWSGFGRENGRFGIEDLLRYRALHGA
ncbi:aldehyde dehydrogenase family protein [Variovorax atrisoli]|uniref:aldehyde dehydrogenase family protein n=1 Tax=Variovorax atrisoli TaxID=3394203 RepID=UPI001607F3DC|nr:aldehyde dehydrogenase family protein [Variovorax sp. BK613]MBB3639568.1 aldehyde dehydrogenase (NAD+) [Variovorax sp. BK613]